MPTKNYNRKNGNHIFICKYCKVNFKDYFSNKNDKNVFCSKKCSYEFRKNIPSWNKGITHTEKHKNNE